MNYSVFEVFRIGIDPSSSHTVGPMSETMRLTGRDMQSKYKETALGGLAVVYC